MNFQVVLQAGWFLHANHMSEIVFTLHVALLQILSGHGEKRMFQSDAQWDDQLLRSLWKEVDILSTLRHPNVVLFLGVCLQPACVVTEYCPLGSLFDVLGKARQDPSFAERLTWARRLLMALDAAKGMLYLHSHKPTILHRDLKSPNLFVDKAWHVKVCQVARALETSTGLSCCAVKTARLMDCINKALAMLQCILCNIEGYTVTAKEHSI